MAKVVVKLVVVVEIKLVYISIFRSISSLKISQPPHMHYIDVTFIAQ